MALNQWLPVSRRGGGEYNTSNFTIPAGITKARVKLDVDPADFSTPGLSVTATIETSRDGAATWQFQMSAGWVGGPLPDPIIREPWVILMTDLYLFTGALVRVHFSTSGSFRWGILGELS